MNKLSHGIPSVMPNPHLFERIVAAVHHKQEQRRIWRLRIFAGSTVVSVVALVPAVLLLINALKQSNFGVYLSLLFSDGLTMWKDIGASLVESLPAVTIAATLALLCLLLWSVRSMIRFMNPVNVI